MTLEFSELKKIGLIIKFQNQPYIILESKHSHLARGKANVRVKLKNLLTGQVIEKTFSGSEKIELADVDRKKTKFLYQKGEQYSFMDQENYEEIILNKNQIQEWIDFLKPGLETEIIYFENKPVAINLPIKIKLKVIEAPPGLKGNTAQSPTKIVTLETGLKIAVPLFIKKNDEIIINTRTKQYVSRA